MYFQVQSPPLIWISRAVNPPSHEIFQHAFRCEYVDFFWNNPMIPFLFSKTFSIVNDKQTTDEQHEYFLIMMELFRQRTTCCIDCTIHEVYISFQISRKVLIDLSASTIHAQRKSLFLLTLQTIHWFFSLQVRTALKLNTSLLHFHP